MINKLDALREAGFTYINFDMASKVSLTAWRGSERKTYWIFGKSSVAEAVRELESQINPPEPDDFEDLF